MSINFLRREPDALSAVLAADTSRTASVSAPTVYERIITWSIMVGVLLVPLLFLPWTTGVLELQKQLLLVLVASVGLIAWLLNVVTSGYMSIRFTGLDKGVLALVGASVIATLFSLSVRSSTFGTSTSSSESLVTTIAFALVYFLIVWTFRGKSAVLVTLLVTSACTALVYGLLQIFGVHVFTFGFAKTRMFTTIGSVNALGIFAALLLPLLMKVSVRIPRVPFLDVAKLTAALAFLFIVILNWWVLWVIVIAGMLASIGFDSVAFTIVQQAENRKFRIGKFIVPMTAIVLGVFLMVVQFSVPVVKTNLTTEVAPSFSFSARLMQSALSQRLLTGFGSENFSLAFDRFGAARLANSSLSGAKFTDGMSQLATWVVDQGLMGLLAFGVLVWALVGAILRFRTSIIRHPGRARALSGILSALIAGSVALCLYPFTTSLFMVFFVLLALTALLLWDTPNREVSIEDKPAYSLASSFGFIIGLIVVLTGGYFMIVRYAADTAYAHALTVKDPSDAIRQFVSAANWGTNDNRIYRALSQAMLAQISVELNAKQDKDDSQRQVRIQNLISSAIAIAKKATDAAPYEPDTWQNLGMVYQNLFGLVENVDGLAEEAYLKAAALRPGDPAYQNRIGSMYLAEADLLRQLARQGGQDAGQLVQRADAMLLKAEAAFKKAIGLAGNYGTAIYNLGAVYDRQGKVNDAIKQIERIAPFNANQPNLMFELGLLYYRAGRKSDALKALQRAVLLAPEFANARWYLALLYEEQLDIPSALAQLKKINESDPNNATVLNKITALEQGQRTIPPVKVIDQKPLQ